MKVAKLAILHCCLLLVSLPVHSNDALFAAIEDKNADAVAVVLDAGADANAVNEAGTSALFAAVQKQSLEMCRLLVARGADINFAHEQSIGATPLMMAVAYNSDEIVTLFIEKGADVDLADTNGDPAINWAAYYGYTGVAEQLLQAGASTQLVGHGNPREIAMRRGHQPFVDLMVRHAGFALPDPETALLLTAIEKADTARLEEALALGVSANSTDLSGRPVLEAAARSGNLAIVERLVMAGAEVDAVDEIGFTALMEAARDGKVDVARFLLEMGANPNHRSGENALFLAPMHMAGLSGMPEMVQLLADAGAEVDPLGRENGTPLMWALGEGKVDASHALLKNGADAMLKNSYGFSAADIARQMGDEALLEAMGLTAEP